MSDLEIGNIKAAPGTAEFGKIVAGNHPAGGELAMPVTVINGKMDGPVLWVNSCIHGDEPQGPLASIFLTQDVNPETLNGALVLVPAMNVPAFEAHKRGNPLDMFANDMNRVYPGGPEGRFTERLAWAHREALVSAADMEISIHSGGDHSFLDKTIFRAPTDAAMELAQAMGRGWDLVLLSPHPKGSPMAELNDQGKPAISIELGGSSHYMPRDFREDGRAIADAVLNVMYHYKMLEGTPQYEQEWFTGSQQAVLANISGLWLAEPDFEFKKPSKKGDLFAKIYDLQGRVLEEIKAPCDGIPFGLRTTAPTHAGDWGIFYAIVDGSVKKLVKTE
jgi:predicted deacylase